MLSSVIPYSSCPQSLNIRVSSSEPALCIRWPKDWSFSFSISPSNEYLGLMSFGIDSFDLLDTQGTQKYHCAYLSSVQFSSVTQSCPTLCNPMDYVISGFLILYHLPELAQTHVHWVSSAIQPWHPLSPHSPSALSLSQHQGLFKWVGFAHQVAKELELQHWSFQWIYFSYIPCVYVDVFLIYTYNINPLLVYVLWIPSYR